MDQHELVLVPAERLPVGKPLLHPLLDSQKRALLTSGTVITASVKEGLLLLGIKDVAIHPEDARAWNLEAARPPSETGGSLVSDARSRMESLRGAAFQSVEKQGAPLREQLRTKGCATYDAEQHARVRKYLEDSAQLIDGFLERVEARQLDDIGPLEAVAAELTGEMVDDMDNAVAATAYPELEAKLAERTVKLALLGMAAAIAMDFDDQHVREVGLSALLHDSGIFAQNPKFRNLRVPLSPQDQRELALHPLVTLELLSAVSDIPEAVLLAVAQVHENPNGTGYPLGLTREEIHPYASLLHVVDAYLSLTLPHRGRRPVVPYDAMSYLLQLVKRGVIESDPMRALLKAVSLFPIGSRVRLSDGSEAQVIRRNDNNYMEPIVQRVGALRKFRADAPHATVIDLANTDIRLIAPLPSPDGQDTRLEESLIGPHPGDGPVPDAE